MNATAQHIAASLTPAQHRAIRRQLFLIPVYGWAVYIWTVFVQQLPFARFGGTAKVFRDFAHFYVLGMIARGHNAGLLYDVSAQKQLLLTHVPGAIDVPFPPSYGPQVALLFRPLAALPYVPALLTWIAVTVLLYLFSSWLVWRECPNLRAQRWPLVVLLVAAPALHFTLMFGQTAALATGCVALMAVALLRERAFLAGCALGLLFYKPQLGLAAGLLFIAAGQWRVVAGAVGVIFAQLVVAAWYWGPHVLVDYGAAVRRIPSTVALIEPDKQHLHAWRAFFQLLGLEHTPLLSATLLASLLTLVAALVCWRRTSDMRLKIAVLLTTTVLINPHMYVYDLMVLTPAGLLLWDYVADARTAARPASWIAGLLVVAFVSPVLGFLAPYTRLQSSVLTLALLTVAVVAVSGSARPAPSLLTTAR